MMDNLIFSLNGTLPFFALIVLGYVLARFDGISRKFFRGLNSFVYRVALPVNLFLNIYSQSLGDVDTRFLGVIFVAVAAGFGGVWLVMEVLHRDNKALIGTLVQGAARGNSALLGVPLAQSVGGDSAGAKAALALVVIVPMYNVLSVVVLTLRGAAPAQTPGHLVRRVAANRLIIGSVAALPFLFLGLGLPEILDRSLHMVGQTATPLGLLSIGGLFQWSAAAARVRPTIHAALIKNFLLPFATMAACLTLGFRGEDLLVLFILFASPTAVGSYSMAVAMGGDGPLASNILILTTLVAAFVFAGGIYCLRSLGLV